MAKEFKVIKISKSMYEKLDTLSKGVGMPISELASKLISTGLRHTETRKEVVEKEILIFKE
ncbi:MAG TPA: hypothetical protein DEB74_01320 [Lachnospiraceae bacterium]|nr:hypothetical protein [Lachnospiraceae bacterium]